MFRSDGLPTPPNKGSKTVSSVPSRLSLPSTPLRDEVLRSVLLFSPTGWVPLSLVCVCVCVLMFFPPPAVFFFFFVLFLINRGDQSTHPEHNLSCTPPHRFDAKSGSITGGLSTTLRRTQSHARKSQNNVRTTRHTLSYSMVQRSYSTIQRSYKTMQRSCRHDPQFRRPTKLLVPTSMFQNAPLEEG